jgi:hypothetical protein
VRAFALERVEDFFDGVCHEILVFLFSFLIKDGKSERLHVPCVRLCPAMPLPMLKSLK